MDENKFPLQTELTNVTRIQPTKILTQFGLQRLRTSIYGGRADGTDTATDADVNESGLTVTSYLGTPVFSNLDFIGGNYKNLQGEEIQYGGGESGEGLRIDTVLFDVAQAKNIVTTEIQGRNGTIKEYISDGDFAININGLIVHPDANTYPETDVSTLMDILKAQTTIGIASRFLNDIFGINSVVVMSYSFPQPEGMQNTQPFQIRCLSNDPIELQIKTR